jgi:nitrate/nitrite transporter NarK
MSHQHSPADSTHFLIIMIASGMVGGLTGACIAAVYVLLASAYAVACRASGIGFALMVGRAGGIATTMVGGALLELAGDSIAPFFVVLTVIAVCAIIGTSILDRDVAPVRR